MIWHVWLLVSALLVNAELPVLSSILCCGARQRNTPLWHMTHGEGNGTPLQCSRLENPMDGGAWWAAVHGVTRSRTWLSDFTFTFHFHALEKAMATHSSVLAWRIPGTGEPGGLPPLGSYRVGHDWRDLAAAAAAAAAYDTQPRIAPEVTLPLLRLHLRQENEWLVNGVDLK